MMNLAQSSKFSCLKIYGDSDSSSGDEQAKSVAKALSGKGDNCGSQRQKQIDKKDKGGLIVHPIPKRRKNKSKKKAKSGEEPTVVEHGFKVQDANEQDVEARYREEMVQARANSIETTSTASLSPELNQEEAPPSDPCLFDTVVIVDDECKQNEKCWTTEEDGNKLKSEAEMLLLEIDGEASVLFTKNDGPQKAREHRLVELYRSRLLDTTQLLLMEEKLKLTARAEAAKYKSRFKKLFELLNDAELNEKAHMVANLTKARNVERELSAEIGKLRGQLMQAESKIRELQGKNYERASKKH